jgi:phospholipase C
MTGLLVAVLVASCSAGGGAGGAGTDTKSQAPASPTSRTSVRASPSVAEQDTRWPIKHVVLIMQENRSFDHLFGAFPGANGAAFGLDHGVTRPMTPVTDQAAVDLPHSYTDALTSFNAGKMDGFNQDAASNRYAYTQMSKQDEPNYWFWAKNNVLSDDFFSAEMGPSYANHFYAIAGQSAGVHDNPVRLPGLHSLTWGCDAPPEEKVRVANGHGGASWQRPCFDVPTIGDALSKGGVDWAYYAAASDQAGYIWSQYSSIRHIFHSPRWNQHVHPVDNVIHDIHSVGLPAVTYITPRMAFSDHPDFNFCYGENWATKVIDAIMASPDWKDTAIFLTWDEWGGFYDHVKPPVIDSFGPGFRVPLIVLSPYAKKGIVDHHQGEFDSVVKFIERNWGLPSMTQRDRTASDLSYDFNFDQKPRPPHPRPVRTDCQGSPWDPSPSDPGDG